VLYRERVTYWIGFAAPVCPTVLNETKKQIQLKILFLHSLGTVLNSMNGGQHEMNLATLKRSPGKDAFQPMTEVQALEPITTKQTLALPARFKR
jgi:hypothetical protein